jgi:hypothetical protein
MASTSILPHFPRLKQLGRRGRRLFIRRNGHIGAARHSPLNQDPDSFPRFVRESPVALRYWRLLSPLAWDHFPERDLCRNYGQPCVAMAPFVAACLIKLDLGFRYMSQLRAYLVDHPALIWVLGFPVMPSSRHPWGFDPEVSLPTHRHFTRLLRKTPNTSFQFLLDETVRLLQLELVRQVTDFGQAISMDTKHILAWVRENNPKDYVCDRYDKTRQPKGDPDCRLGCKRRRNQRISSQDPPPTPSDNPLPASTISVGEYHWGYASGVVATKVPGWGEFVLAELTQPFNCSDVSYFHPLMADVEHRLGFRPRFGAFDAAFDAWYVYEYFHRDGQSDPNHAFAAVPFSQRGGHKLSFDQNDLPLCRAGLPMPLKSTFWSKRGLMAHQCGRYVCSLRFPQETDKVCLINHKQWPKGGCITKIPTSIGTRVRYQLDRDSEAYKHVYKQRTATERVNSQAVELGIERPKLRNGKAITNQNTLTYVLINLRAFHRVRRKKAAQAGTAAAQNSMS